MFLKIDDIHRRWPGKEIKENTFTQNVAEVFINFIYLKPAVAVLPLL